MVLVRTLFKRVGYGLQPPTEAGDPGVLVHDYHSDGPGEWKTSTRLRSTQLFGPTPRLDPVAKALKHGTRSLIPSLCFALDILATLPLSTGPPSACLAYLFLRDVERLVNTLTRTGMILTEPSRASVTVNESGTKNLESLQAGMLIS